MASTDLTVELSCRLGTRGGAAELKSHPFFAGVQWDSLRHSRAPNIPALKNELDTSNFEKFDEQEGPAGGGRRRANRKDPDFMCFTYKNFRAVGSDESAPRLLSVPKSSGP